MPRNVTLASERAKLAELLALSMTVADLAGRARVLDEAADELDGRRLPARTGLSFSETHIKPLALRGAVVGVAGTPITAFEAQRHQIRTPAKGGVAARSTPRSGPLPPTSGAAALALFADAQILVPEKLAPAEALEFFRTRIGMTRVAFDKLGRRYRELAFTVARIESVGVIEEIQRLLADVLAEGQTGAEFERRVDELMRSRGLSPLNPFHIETVFRTNVAAAYNTGRVIQMSQADVKKALPFWRYLTVLDSRVREKHRALHGFIARNDDPVWRRIFPPNGFNCRCQVVAVTRAKAARLAEAGGQDLTADGQSRLTPDQQPDDGFESSPVAAFERRLQRGRLGLSTFTEWLRRAA